MKKNEINSAFAAFKKIIILLPKRMQWAIFFLFMGMVFKALIETATMGLIAFFAASLAKPETMLQSESLAMVQAVTGLDFFTTLKGFLISLSFIIVFLVLFKNLFKMYITFWTGRHCAKIEAFIGEFLLNGFLKMPYQWHIKQNSADLIFAIETRKEVGRNFVNCMIKLCSEFILVAIMIAALLIMQPLVSLLVLFVSGGSSLVIYLNIAKFIDATADNSKYFETKINKDCTKAVHGIKDVKILGREHTFVDETQRSLASFAWHYAKYKFFEQSPPLLLEFVGFLMLTSAVCLMLFVLESSPMQAVATISLLAVAAWKCLPAMQRMLGGIAQVKYSIPFVNMVLDYMDQIQKLTIDGIPEGSVDNQMEFNDKIVIQDLFFRYDRGESYVLQDLSITVEKGESVGIIGTSGAGKSTLVDLIIGLLKPTNGGIYIDNVPLNEKTEARWKKMIGYVSQSPYIYDGTLAENIAFGISAEKIDYDEVQKSVRMAYMDNFISELPNGIHTEIGERGVRLSGGQQQRVAIARALYHDPIIMVFDEATSALDTKTEKEIKKTIYSLKQKKTLIIIAHRLTTVEDCNRIFWIENGSIRDVGTPDEILYLHEANE